VAGPLAPLTLALAQARRSGVGASRPVETGVMVAFALVIAIASVIAGNAAVPPGV